MKRRLLSALLAFCMTLTLCPASMASAVDANPDSSSTFFLDPEDVDDTKAPDSGDTKEIDKDDTKSPDSGDTTTVPDSGDTKETDTDDTTSPDSGDTKTVPDSDDTKETDTSDTKPGDTTDTNPGDTTDTKRCQALRRVLQRRTLGPRAGHYPGQDGHDVRAAGDL